MSSLSTSSTSGSILNSYDSCILCGRLVSSLCSYSYCSHCCNRTRKSCLVHNRSNSADSASDPSSLNIGQGLICQGRIDSVFEYGLLISIMIGENCFKGILFFDSAILRVEPVFNRIRAETLLNSIKNDQKLTQYYNSFKRKKNNSSANSKKNPRTKSSKTNELYANPYGNAILYNSRDLDTRIDRANRYEKREKRKNQVNQGAARVE